MLSYEVTIHLSDLSLVAPLESYMHNKHLGDVLATGCFLDWHFERSAPDIFRSRYTLASQQDLDRYLTEHASALRADFHQHFPSGVRLARSVWSELAGTSR